MQAMRLRYFYFLKQGSSSFTTNRMDNVGEFVSFREVVLFASFGKSSVATWL